MKSRHVIEERKNHLLMRITGPYDYWEFIRYPDIIRQQCEATGIYRIVVDLKGVTQYESSTPELFFLGEKLADKLRHRIKIALVWNTVEQGEFLQNVATNRAASMKIFNTVERATKWLLFDHEDEPSGFFRY